ncbi:MAG: hypothetical protein LLG14_18375 [Nocardiaceae bacterium]|nr:hypothetical protein [Nocardiaceae bacterium]
MCYAKTCRKCGKTTWGGCGQHKDSVMRSVPRSERCACATASAAATTTSPKQGFWRSMFRA